MKQSSNKKKWLADKNTLAALYAKNSKNIRLFEQVVAFLVDDFQPHILQCSYFQQVLTLEVSNQLIASKLRYSLPQLIAKLQGLDTFSRLRKIRIKIKSIDKLKPTTSKASLKPVYSNDSSSIVMSLSDSIGDPELQLSLQKLAQHIKSSSASKS